LIDMKMQLLPLFIHAYPQWRSLAMPGRDESQRAMVAAKVANLAHGQKKSESQNCDSAISQADAAKMAIAAFNTPCAIQSWCRPASRISGASDAIRQ
jgi:hypothetical protein